MTRGGEYSYYMSSSLHELTELLRELPGIGPRQARRLALWLAERDRAWVDRLSTTLKELKRTVHTCTSCMHLFEPVRGVRECTICSNQSREHSTLLIVEKDVDMENIERTGTYKGLYFILGGTTSLLDKRPEQRTRIVELEKRLQHTTNKIDEVVLALSATTEGEDTTAFLLERLAPLITKQSLKVTVLGRGLSTGTELEYVDVDTMKSALAGRHAA